MAIELYKVRYEDQEHNRMIVAHIAAGSACAARSYASIISPAPFHGMESLGSNDLVRIMQQLGPRELERIEENQGVAHLIKLDGEFLYQFIPMERTKGGAIVPVELELATTN